MLRPLVIASIAAFALGGCASYDSGYRHGYADGSDRGSYNDGYGGYGYDRSQFAWDAYAGYGYTCPGFGYGFGYFPDRSGYGFGSQLGYAPWICNPGYGYGYSYGYPYGWYRPWPRHHHHDNDHDADDPPGVWSNNTHVGAVQVQAATALGDRLGVRLNKPARQPGLDYRYQRDPIRRPAPMDVSRTHDGDGFRTERREPSENRSHPRDASQR